MWYVVLVFIAPALNHLRARDSQSVGHTLFRRAALSQDGLRRAALSVMDNIGCGNGNLAEALRSAFKAAAWESDTRVNSRRLVSSHPDCCLNKSIRPGLFLLAPDKVGVLASMRTDK